MKALSVAWGLLVDDARLATIVVITIIVAAILKFSHATAFSPLVMIVGFILALLVSVEHQLRLKRKKKA